jgi:signal transduction histidine kinase/DNA-binding response OmpR family regulator
MTPEFQANVLLVDDRPENLLVMETILADLKQNLIRATSGAQALRYLLTEEVALILLDVQMPDLNGFELAEMIRERERTERTPIIFISAVSINEQYIFKGYSLGAVDYLTKPFEPEILKSKVRFFTELFRQNQEIKRQAALLEKANAELDSLNTQLEARVRRRTTELEAANAELENEIASRKESEARLATEHAITRALAVADDFAAAAPLILKSFCEHLKAEISCLWLLNQDGTRLSCVHIETSRAAGDLATFVSESRRADFAVGTGLPGHVWEKKAPVWLPDTVRGEKFPRATFAASCGLHSAIGFPILIGREFYGVIEFFTRRPLLSDRSLINMVEAIGSEIGQFIQRKKLEAERENLLLREKHLREQAETASRLKDEFLATVSHELRTPLNAVLGWAQMLKTGRIAEKDREGAVETIYRSAKSQAQLIDDLLDTSRLITGNLRLNLSPTSVVSIIESALAVVRPIVEAKKITLLTAYSSEVESITCDAQRLQQMIWNLLTNAVKFTPDGGKVEVRLERKDESVQIIVSDTGQGIPPEFLPFVFDRFRQEDSSNTRKHNGLGLGLAIVRHLAELHGGTVAAESAGTNQGATFTLTLPYTLAPNASDNTNENADENAGENAAVANGHNGNSEASLAGVRVLVVDDDCNTCELLTFVLNQWGAETRAETSVAAALAALDVWQPDVLISDLSMPDEDGFSLIKKIRKLESEKNAHIPAIALTALARAEDNERAIAAGFQVHLTKPVDAKELADSITNLVKYAAV